MRAKRPGGNAERPQAQEPATVWLLLCLALAATAYVFGLLTGLDALTALYFIEHDLVFLMVGWALLRFAPAAGERLAPIAGGTAALASRPVLLALAVGVVAYVGVWLVMSRHALSGDEGMAVFDTRIFAAGRWYAEVPPEWRAYAPALQPMFRLSGPEQEWWVSAYLPVNAALRSGFARLGDAAASGPFWAALSVLLVYAVGRRLEPARPSLAVCAAVLLATSSQLLVTAMTPYAMSAHLALNLLWLLLFLRGGLLGHAGAIVVGFAATGLHQLIFHPLFAAPFCLQLLLRRRWATAAAYGAGYAAIGLFWASYWGSAFPTPPGGEQFGSAGGWMARAWGHLSQFDISAFGYMAVNLFRFVTWQNPLLAPAAVLGAAAAWRLGGNLRALAMSAVLTPSVMFFLLPYQGHGWGYRYMHGLLGGAALLAALGWLRLVDALPAESRRRAWRGFCAVAASAALIVFPLRAWQAYDYTRPYAAAHRAIERAPVAVVVVDDSRLWFGADLVTNDPFLRNRPKVMDLKMLEPAAIAGLCRYGPVALFDEAAGRRVGLRGKSTRMTPVEAERRARIRALPCLIRAFS
jgi:hypothetical protein